MHTTAEVYSFAYRLKSIHLCSNHVDLLTTAVKSLHFVLHKCQNKSISIFTDLLLQIGFRKIYENIQGLCAAA